MQIQEIAQSWAVNIFIGGSLALNGYFLRGVATRLRDVEKTQVKDGNRLTAVEVALFPNVRRTIHDSD